jgi:hypothetical protein
MLEEEHNKMKTQKTILFLVLSMFLLSTISAVSITPEFSDLSTSRTIINPASADFSFDFFTMNAPMTVKIELVNSAGTVLNTFLAETSITTREHTFSGTVTSAMYLTAGTYSIEATARDAVGYTDLGTLTLIVNNPANAAPVITLTGANPQLITRGSAYVELGATVTDDVDTGLTATIDSTAVNTAVNGDYNVVYSVTDSASNTATATRVVRVVDPGTDLISPTVTISSPANGATYNTPVTSLRFTATDTNLAACEYSINGGTTRTNVVCTSGTLENVALTSVAGSNTWTVYVRDSAGNTASASVTFTYDSTAPDTTAPSISVVVPTNRKYSSDRINFKIVTDESATVECKVDSGSRRTMVLDTTNTYLYSATLSNGNHIVTFYATDTAGNVATPVSVSFSVDDNSNSDSSGGSLGTVTVGSPSSSSSGSSSGTGSRSGQVSTIILTPEKAPTKTPSVFQAFIEAIANFFKWLFGSK